MPTRGVSLYADCAVLKWISSNAALTPGPAVVIVHVGAAAWIDEAACSLRVDHPSALDPTP
jgi:hypothetical protein